MRHAATAILIVLSVFLLKTATAQQQLFKIYTVNEGLVDNQIRCIYQDSKGFIWIGTWEGLSKYDGHKFTNYFIGNGLINDFFETQEGVLYIACNDGSLYVVKNNTEPLQIKKTGFPINRLKRSVNDKIIAITDYEGFFEFNNGILFKPPQPRPWRKYYELNILNDSLFILQSDSTIEIINDRYELIAESALEPGMFTETSMLIDSKKRTWVGSVNGLRLLSPYQQKGQPLRFQGLPPAFNIHILKESFITDIYEDIKENLWFATPGGLIKIGANGSRQFLSEKSNLPLAIYCLFQDREENIWIGTTHGLAKLVTKTDIRVYPPDKESSSYFPLFIFPFNDSTILLGVNKVDRALNKNKKEFMDVPVPEKNYSNEKRKNGLSLLKDDKYKAMRLVFPNNDKMHSVFFGSSPVYYCKDRRGNIFSPGTAGSWFTHDFTDWQKVFNFNLDTRSLLIDRTDNLWLGTIDSGLYRIRYDYVNDTPRLISKEHFFPGMGIRSLYQDSKGNLWIGTRYNGAYVIDPNAKKENVILHFNKSNGLTSNRITAIGEDKNGAIWLCFFNGFDKLIPDKTSYRAFNFSRVHNFFTNIHQMIFDEDHSLWLLTSKGLVNIVDGEMENEQPLKTYITSAELGDSTYITNPAKKISLSYKHRQVQYEFAAPGFINQQQILYSYRLIGSNNTDWSQPANVHSVSYASLQPGDYRFEVRNKGWNGEWGEAAAFEFSIAPPFWQTWWFRLVLVLFIASLITWLVRRRIKTIRHEAEMKQKISETEMMALRAQMNPHFIFNCLNAIDNLVQTNQKEKATTYLARFAKLIRIVLESSKNNVVPFQKDFESLQLYLQMEQFRCNNKFSYELTADDELLQSDYKVPPLIIQPFVENAIHHGLLNKESCGRKLAVNATLESDVIKYSVTDNGVGRARAKEIKELNKPDHQSYGIGITAERVHLYNQHKRPDDIVITDLWENGVAAGTKVEIRLNIYDDK